MTDWRGVTGALRDVLVEKYAERTAWEMDGIGSNDSLMRLLQCKIITETEARMLMIKAGHLDL